MPETDLKPRKSQNIKTGFLVNKITRLRSDKNISQGVLAWVTLKIWALSNSKMSQWKSAEVSLYFHK